MDNKSEKLLITPSICKTSLSDATPQSLLCTGSATGNLRNKCALKPGHSLMDWIRLGNSGADLSGTGGRLILVSEEELIKHNTINDAWLALRGVVYNVTQYMEFHPGGIEELMRCVGSDATKLFNETHAWVNYSQLLDKCRIGPLTSRVKSDAQLEKLITLPNKNLSAIPTKPVQQNDLFPRLDWIQTSNNITLYFYTKQFCNPGSIIRHLIHEGGRVEIWILIGCYVHTFDFELQGRIKWPPKKVQISTESGKIEIKLNKHEDQINLWSDLGNYKSSRIMANALELEPALEFKMLSKNKFNYDSFVMVLKNENVIYIPPVGYHLTIENFVNGKKINKCYTPVPKNYAHKSKNIEFDMEYIHLLIKYYANPNSVTQYLCNLDKETTIKISLPKGNLKLSTLATHTKFCFLAAGSGLTPFLGLIDHLLNRKANRIEVLKLCYFNKTIKDIWCHDNLTNLSTEDSRFEFVNILSNADESWSGLKGRVNSELLFSIVNNSMENISYIAACGPSNFITFVKKLLQELNFPNENLFIF